MYNEKGKQTKTAVLAIVLAMAFALIIVGSCKKRSEPAQAEGFDPALDGIAVRSPETMDIEKARRIVRDGPLSAVADATDESVLAAAEAVKLAVPAETSASDVLPDMSAEPSPETPGLIDPNLL